MITIDWTSFVLGALIMFALFEFIIWTKRNRKPKHDLHNIKKTISDTGIKTKEVYIKLQELFKMFEEMEK